MDGLFFVTGCRFKVGSKQHTSNLKHATCNLKPETATQLLLVAFSFVKDACTKCSKSRLPVPLLSPGILEMWNVHQRIRHQKHFYYLSIELFHDDCKKKYYLSHGFHNTLLNNLF